MKLAAALLERADLQRRISDLGSRLNNNAKVQDGASPFEDPKALIEDLDRDFEAMETLIARINHTNNAAMVDGVSLTDLLAKRDCLKQRISIIRTFLDNASAPVSRYSLKEIMVYSTVDVKELQKAVDRIAKELREVDEKIQGANWTIDLI